MFSQSCHDIRRQYLPCNIFLDNFFISFLPQPTRFQFRLTALLSCLFAGEVDVGSTYWLELINNLTGAFVSCASLPGSPKYLIIIGLEMEGHFLETGVGGGFPQLGKKFIFFSFLWRFDRFLQQRAFQCGES